MMPERKRKGNADLPKRADEPNEINVTDDELEEATVRINP